MDEQKLLEMFSLPDNRLADYAAIEGERDKGKWLFGYSICADYDEIDVELKGKISNKTLRDIKAKALRQAAAKAGIKRAAASRRYNVSKFYSGAETEYNFSWSQFDAIKSAGKAWRDFVDGELLPAMEKYGGEVATCEAIREAIKKWKGGTDEDETALWEVRCGTIEDLMAVVLADIETPPQVKVLFSEWSTVLYDTLAKLEHGNA